MHDDIAPSLMNIGRTFMKNVGINIAPQGEKNAVIRDVGIGNKRYSNLAQRKTMIQKTMLEEDNVNIDPSDNVCRTLDFDKEVVLCMTEEDRDRKLACLKLKRDERHRRLSLGLPEHFVFNETFTTEDIDREVQIMSSRRVTRGRPESTTAGEAGVEVEGQNSTWGNTRAFGGRDRDRRGPGNVRQSDQVDRRNIAENNADGGNVRRGEDDADDESTDSSDSSDSSDPSTNGGEHVRYEDFTTFTRAQLLEKCEQYQEQLDELKRKLDDEHGRRPKKRVKKQLPEPKTMMEKRLVKDMKIVLRTYIIHHVSNQPKGWEKYSDDPGSMCQIVMNKMKQWPAQWRKEDKTNAWNGLLGPRFNREWSYAKNEVVTRMRLVCLGTSYIGFIIPPVTCYIILVSS